jgi:putative transposase
MVGLPTQPRRSFIDSQAHCGKYSRERSGFSPGILRRCTGAELRWRVVECPAFFEPVALIKAGLQGAIDAQDGRSRRLQVVNLLRQIEVAVANGKTTSQACKEAEITEQTYYRWRKEYRGLQVDQARQLKELESENAKLKRLVSELSLEDWC